MIDDATREVIEKEIDDLQHYSERLVDDIYQTKQLQDAVIRDIDATRREIVNIRTHRDLMRQSRPQDDTAPVKRSVPLSVPPLWGSGTATPRAYSPEPGLTYPHPKGAQPVVLSSSRDTAEALRQRHEAWKKTLATQLDKMKVPHGADYRVVPPPIPSGRSPRHKSPRSPARAGGPPGGIMRGGITKSVVVVPPAAQRTSDFLTARSTHSDHDSGSQWDTVVLDQPQQVRTPKKFPPVIGGTHALEPYSQQPSVGASEWESISARRPALVESHLTETPVRPWAAAPKGSAAGATEWESVVLSGHHGASERHRMLSGYGGIGSANDAEWESVDGGKN